MARDREILTGNLLGIWELYSKNYREAVETYNELLRQKKLRNIKPIRAVKVSVLNEWEEIEFFNLLEEKEVIKFLEGKEVKELKFLEKELLKAVESYEYKTVTSKIREFKNEIYRFDSRKTKNKALKGARTVAY